MTALDALIQEAQAAVDADDRYWSDPAAEGYARGQDSEEAEHSGYLIGYLEGLQTAKQAS